MIKYGKASGPLLAHKQDYFDLNESNLEEMTRLARLYAEQPIRAHCKNCDALLFPELPAGDRPATFTSLGVEYIVCSKCSHLNGYHEDTLEFCSEIYNAGDGSPYDADYLAADRQAYMDRVRDIYQPKADFLAQALKSSSRAISETDIADIGAGAGYFVAALKNLGVRSVVGHEVSASQVELGRAMLKDVGAINEHNFEDTVSIASKTTASLVSMIGVLEHLDKPRDMLSALASNDNVEFIFFSVPLFSPCVFMELTHPRVFPRQLSGAHTHLYTEKSITYFCEEFGFEPVAEWWFGTDMVDFYRNLLVTLADNRQSAEIVELCARMVKPVIDDLQLALDKRRLSSEVHMLLAKVVR